MPRNKLLSNLPSDAERERDGGGVAGRERETEKAGDGWISSGKMRGCWAGGLAYTEGFNTVILATNRVTAGHAPREKC